MTQETKHTPGPWVFDEDTGCIYYADGDVLPDVASVFTDNTSPEQWKADGRLIAASPELLAAACDNVAIMEQALKIIDAHRAIALGDGDISAMNVRAMLKRTRAVIEKALAA
jgi:hypothetical protein